MDRYENIVATDGFGQLISSWPFYFTINGLNFKIGNGANFFTVNHLSASSIKCSDKIKIIFSL